MGRLLSLHLEDLTFDRSTKLPFSIRLQEEGIIRPPEEDTIDDEKHLPCASVAHNSLVRVRGR